MWAVLALSVFLSIHLVAISILFAYGIYEDESLTWPETSARLLYDPVATMSLLMILLIVYRYNRCAWHIELGVICFTHILWFICMSCVSMRGHTSCARSIVDCQCNRPCAASRHTIVYPLYRLRAIGTTRQ
jgi:uncharacterized membrane protein YgdD (TMEM256/DUF423 family)